MSLSALSAPFKPAFVPATTTASSTKATPATTSIGYKMMEKMGWIKETPLGIRGKGILEPVKVSYRHDLDYRGLGFEEFQTEENEVDKVSIKITKVGEHYGTATSDYGKVYIPMGALKHISNISRCRLYDLPEIHFQGRIKKTEQKIKWKLDNVERLLGFLRDIAPHYTWCGPYIQ